MIRALRYYSLFCIAEVTIFFYRGAGVTELTVSYLAEAEDISDMLSSPIHFFWLPIFLYHMHSLH